MKIDRYLKLIRGINGIQAASILSVKSSPIAHDLSKLLKNGMNACMMTTSNTDHLAKNGFILQEVYSTRGRFLKRMKPASKGHQTIIRKPYSRIFFKLLINE
jgi:ribosomal protein L22